jgi:hypothetical protein
MGIIRKGDKGNIVLVLIVCDPGDILWQEKQHKHEIMSGGKLTHHTRCFALEAVATPTVGQ